MTGSGGLGKSTLAVRAAHLLADRFPGGQLYVNLLGATQPADPASILARLLRDLGVAGAQLPADEEELAARYRTRLAVPLDAAPPGVTTLAFGSLDEARAWCEEERGNLIAATRLAARSSLHEIAWKLPAAAMSFYYRRSHWSDWEMSHQIGLASARALADRMAEGWILNNLGMAYGVQRRQESLQFLHSARALFGEVSDTYGEGRATINLANTYFRLGLYAQARAEAWAYLQQPSQRPISAGIAWNVLGCASRALGDIAEALGQLQRALTSFRELGEESNQASCLNDLGMVYLDIEDLRSARKCLEEAAVMKKAVGDQEGHAEALSYLARVEHRAGNTERRERSWRRACVSLSRPGIMR